MCNNSVYVFCFDAYMHVLCMNNFFIFDNRSKITAFSQAISQLETKSLMKKVTLLNCVEYQIKHCLST